MKLIAAVDKNWAIGNKGKLLVRISEDQKFFKNTTMGHVVVLGRKTLEEFPKHQPLAGRTNIILSTNPEYIVSGAVVVHSIEELFQELIRYDSDDIFIIGGESVYNRMYKYCDTAYITRIDKEYEADAFIPNLDSDDNWKIAFEGECGYTNDIYYKFTTYTNSNVEHFH